MYVQFGKWEKACSGYDVIKMEDESFFLKLYYSPTSILIYANLGIKSVLKNQFLAFLLMKNARKLTKLFFYKTANWNHSFI